eukprot:3355747-Alexandrium_andersonii.AAC.1
MCVRRAIDSSTQPGGHRAGDWATSDGQSGRRSDDHQSYTHHKCLVIKLCMCFCVCARIGWIGWQHQGSTNEPSSSHFLIPGGSLLGV